VSKNNPVIINIDIDHFLIFKIFYLIQNNIKQRRCVVKKEKKIFNPRIEIFSAFKKPFEEYSLEVIPKNLSKTSACCACTACTACR
jgi:hypothetical protein